MFRFTQILLILFFGLYLQVFAQNPHLAYIDSLQKILPQQKPEDQAKIYIDICWKIRHHNNGAAIGYAWKAVAIARRIQNVEIEVDALNRLSVCYRNEHKGDTALLILDTLIPKAKNVPKQLAYAYNNLGSVYGHLTQNPELFIENSQKALAIFERIGEKAASIDALRYLSLGHNTNKNYDSAMFYAKKALVLSKQFERWNDVVISLTYVGIQYLQMKDTLNFRKNIRRAMHIRQAKNLGSFPPLFSHYADDLLAQNKLDSAKLLLEYIKTNKLINDDDYTFYDNLAKYYLLKKDSSKAILPLMTVRQILDSSYEKRREMILANHALVKKQEEVEIISQEKKLQERVNYLVGAGLVSSLFFSMLILISRRKIRKAYKDLENANREITEQKKEIQNKTEKLEAALQHLQQSQAQLIQSEKSGILQLIMATISHEINNPINYVKAGTQVLKNNIEILKQFVEQSTQSDIAPAQLYHDLEIKEYQEEIDLLLEDIALGAEKTIDIIQKLKIFIRLDEQGKKEVDISENINAVLVILRNRFMGKIEIQTDFVQNLHKVSCDISQINQVFLSLLLNASQAIEGQGKIKVATFEQGDFVAFSIQDTGKGIDQSIQERIFEPFVSTKKSSGLGLYIAQQIISEHKGKITFQTSPQGTCFSVFLPKKSISSV